MSKLYTIINQRSLVKFIITFFSCFCASVQSFALDGNTLVIPAGTVVTVQSTQDISQKTLLGGEQFDFFIADDVKVAGQVAIKGGTKITGKVSSVEKPKGMGKPGSISILFEHATAVDGSSVQLNNNTITATGVSMKKSVVLLGTLYGIMFGPEMFLLYCIKGKPASIPSGSAYVCNVAYPATIRNVNPVPDNTAYTPPPSQDFTPTITNSRNSDADLSALGFSRLNRYKYIVLTQNAPQTGAYSKIINRYDDAAFATVKNWLSIHGVPLIADPSVALNNGAFTSDLIYIKYDNSQLNMQSAKTEARGNATPKIKITGQDSKLRIVVSVSQDMERFPGTADGYGNLFTSLLNKYSTYYYNYEAPAPNTAVVNTAPPVQYQPAQTYNRQNTNSGYQQTSNNNNSQNTNYQQTSNATKNLTSDVDINIPSSTSQKSNRFALIVGNEDYSTYQQGLSTEANVDYAAHDASVFKEYAVKTLGIPDDNIIFITNANTRDLNRSIDKLSLLAKATGGDGELFFYYAGHGYPDEVTKEAYIIPVDVSGAELQYALKLKDVYRKLTEHHSKKVVCFLDACFSGGARNMSLMASRGIKIKPKEDALSGNMVVYSAVSNDEASLPYKDKAHGMFTYYLLKKLQETKGDISFGDLSEFLEKQVSVKSIMVNSKEQNPTMVTSPDLGDSWKNWKMK